MCISLLTLGVFSNNDMLLKILKLTTKHLKFSLPMVYTQKSIRMD